MSAADWAVILCGAPLALGVVGAFCALVLSAWDGDEDSALLLAVLVVMALIGGLLFGIDSGGLQ